MTAAASIPTTMTVMVAREAGAPDVLDPHRPKPLVVGEQPVGQPVHHGALEAELDRRAFELIDRGFPSHDGSRVA